MFSVIHTGEEMEQEEDLEAVQSYLNIWYILHLVLKDKGESTWNRKVMTPT